MIASGDKLIDDPEEAFFAAVVNMWPKLLAVEMEGAGVAAAVHAAQSQRHSVGFVLVRGISDMPHAKTAGEGASTGELETDRGAQRGPLPLAPRGRGVAGAPARRGTRAFRPSAGAGW